MFFEGFVTDEFGNFNNFVERKYVLSEHAFTRKGKLSLASIIKYPLCNHKKTTSIEVNRLSMLFGPNPSSSIKSSR